MTSLHQHINQENVREQEGVVERLLSRWSSSSRVITDRPPSQPLSCRQMSGGPSGGSVKESHKDPGMGDAPHRRQSAVERPQPSESKWTSGSGIIADRPPVQPLSPRRIAVGKLQQSDSIRALCILNLSRKSKSIAVSVNLGTRLQCVASRSA
jgi:hypothetical protein